jgi:hypothetical protein
MTSLLVQTDTAPTATAIITNDATGAPLPLAGCQVYFQVRKTTDRRFQIDGLCAITDADAGAVSYDFAPDDLDFAADCYVRFLVIYPDSRRQHTVPQIDLTVQEQ